MTEPKRDPEKLEKPSTYFSEPHDVVTDGELSDRQKRTALDTLEQDARQLADATAEGMTGGERSNLDEVLDAKAALVASTEYPPHRASGLRDHFPQAIGQYPFTSLALALIAGVGIGASLRR